MLGLFSLHLIRQLCSLLRKREPSGSQGRERVMPQCHPITHRSKEAKSQVSPSGAITDPALHLGAIIGSSYLNSVQLSLSIFILFLIRLVITIPQRHWQTPTPILLQSDGAKWPLMLQLTPKTQNLYLKDTTIG